MSRNLVFLIAALLSLAAQAQQNGPDPELEAPMQVLDHVADLDDVIDERGRRAAAPPAVMDAEDEAEAAPDVEENNAFSGLQDDFEHDDVDIYNAPDLDHEDDFEEDEEVDQEEFID